MTHKPDNLYATQQDPLTKFIFDEKVADVFPDMVSRSIPGYGTIISQIGMLANRFAGKGTRIYDLGCSLGAATLVMRHSISHTDCRIIAVDNSRAMVQRCLAHIRRDAASIPVCVKQGDILDIRIENASVVLLNFTLQFIAPEKRDQVVKNIFNGLNPDGILILSEKITFSEEDRQVLIDGLYHDFKRFNGYSELEISQKREALESVLIREPEESHIKRLKQTGFRKVEKWFQCFNFVSFMALK